MTDNPRAGCDPRCYGCTGPTNNDCIACGKHASLNSYGACECDSYWGGDDCMISTMYGGVCDKRCDGCTGPSAFECIVCGEHAHKNDFGQCICDDYWYGDDCNSYSKDAGYQSMCDPKCLGGCRGGSAYDCYACVNHSTRNSAGACECDSFWVGDDCSYNSFSYTKTNTCDAKCRGCTGPTDYDCVDCVMNASFDSYKRCVCEPYYFGASCDTYSLNAKGCHEKCNGCTGPSEYDCIACVDNA
jgi:proprotein convertase subtilisin/kexin type 5